MHYKIIATAKETDAIKLAKYDWLGLRYQLKIQELMEVLRETIKFNQKPSSNHFSDKTAFLLKLEKLEQDYTQKLAEIDKEDTTLVVELFSKLQTDYYSLMY